MRLHGMIRRLFLASILCAVSGYALEPSRLEGVRPAMEAAVAAKQAAGIVTLVMEKGRVVHHEAVGMADIGTGRKMEKDALFWIASMTKSVNAAAVMTLVDDKSKGLSLY